MEQRIGENETMRRPCSCGHALGYVILKNGQQCMYCENCNKFQYNKPKDRPWHIGYETIATLHKPGGKSFYTGKRNAHCLDCGTVDKRPFYLFKNPDGSLALTQPKP